MYINRTLDGRDEPVDCELMAAHGEVLEAIIDSAIANGSVGECIYVPDDITQDDIEIETADYVTPADIKEIEKYLSPKYDSTTAKALMRIYFRKRDAI